MTRKRTKGGSTVCTDKEVALEDLKKTTRELTLVNIYLHTGGKHEIFSRLSKVEAKKIYDLSRQFELEATPRGENNLIRKVWNQKGKGRHLRKRLTLTHWKQVIPILEGIHRNLDHPGMEKMWQIFSAKYYFPRVRKYIQALVSKCEVCMVNRLTTPAIAPLKAFKKTDRAMQALYIDFKILPNQWCVLNFVCHWSKWLFSQIWPNETVVNVLEMLAEMKRNPCFKVPEVIFSDNGSHFKNLPLARWCAENNVDKQEGAPYWPQGQGVVERVNGTIGQKVGFGSLFFQLLHILLARQAKRASLPHLSYLL
jgi:hypothetical protein